MSTNNIVQQLTNSIEDIIATIEQNATFNDDFSAIRELAEEIKEELSGF